MRILVLDASPKKVSDTMRATSMFVKGIEDLNQGDVIEVVKLINCEIKPCLGCFQCGRIWMENASRKMIKTPY